MITSYSNLYREQLRSDFSYLEHEFGYIYDVKDKWYVKGNLKIFTSFEPHAVSVDYWLMSEPRFTSMPISTLLEMLQKNAHPAINDRASVEETIEIYALFYKPMVDQIAQNFPQMLLPALKWSFTRALSITHLTVAQLLEADDFRSIYDYIHAKDQSWTP